MGDDETTINDTLCCYNNQTMHDLSQAQEVQTSDSHSILEKTFILCYFAQLCLSCSLLNTHYDNFYPQCGAMVSVVGKKFSEEKTNVHNLPTALSWLILFLRTRLGLPPCLLFE